MSYQDPYAARYDQHDQQHYGQADAFNPYTNTQHPHETYEQGGYPAPDAGYRDEPFNHPTGYAAQPYEAAPPGTQYAVAKPEGDRGSGFEQGEFTPREKMAAPNYKAYRHEMNGNLWTKGSRIGCVGRFCCCTILIAFFLFVSIILALALWIRPPAVVIGEIGLPTTGSTVQVTDDGFDINLNLNVSVSNPNYFGVDLKKVKTQLFYSLNGNDTDIGGGTTTNVNFPSNSNKTVTFPFAIQYTSDIDPSGGILLDLATKCGLVGSSSSQITVDYKVTLSIRILIITVSPTISDSFSFDCPLDESDLGDLLGSVGISGLTGS